MDRPDIPDKCHTPALPNNLTSLATAKYRDTARLKKTLKSQKRLASIPAWAKHVPGDDVSLYLTGAFPDALNSRITPNAFQRQI